MQYEKVPRKIPSVHCVTRSLEKLTMMRGENCIDARVSVISRMANTMDTTVMMEAAMSRQNDLGDLRVGVRGEQGRGHPGAGGWKLLFQPRQECTRATQRQRDGERANQKAATQVIHSVAKH
jgi:hypothetical protein